MAVVLIVDDDLAVGSSLAAFLEDYGHRVWLSSDGEAALESVAEHPIDIAVVDLRLPMMNGEQLIHQLHGRFGVRHFLIHTGAVHYSLPQDLVQIGLTSRQVLYKPLADLNMLLDAIAVELADQHG